MFRLFTLLADWIVYRVLGMAATAHGAQSLHFFIEDTTKIFFMLFVMIYVIALIRASLNVERVRSYLSGKHRFFGYATAAGFGAITPFCSCSSIPLFLGFTQTRIPIGITMSFLITSPMINEVAIVLLGGLLGVKFTTVYVIVGIAAGMVGGLFFDLIRAEKYLTPLVATVRTQPVNTAEADVKESARMTFRERHQFARAEVLTIVGKRIASRNDIGFHDEYGRRKFSRVYATQAGHEAAITTGVLFAFTGFVYCNGLDF